MVGAPWYMVGDGSWSGQLGPDPGGISMSCEGVWVGF